MLKLRATGAHSEELSAGKSRRTERERKGQGRPMDKGIQGILRCVRRMGAFEKVLQVGLRDATDVGRAGVE